MAKSVDSWLLIAHPAISPFKAWRTYAADLLPKEILFIAISSVIMATLFIFTIKEYFKKKNHF